MKLAIDFTNKKDGEDICYLCEDCDKYDLCEYYHNRKPTSYICKFFKLKEDAEGVEQCDDDCEHCESSCPWLVHQRPLMKPKENEEEIGKDVLTAMKESAEAVKNSPHYDFSCVTSLFREEADE